MQLKFLLAIENFCAIGTIHMITGILTAVFFVLSGVVVFTILQKA